MSERTLRDKTLFLVSCGNANRKGMHISIWFWCDQPGILYMRNGHRLIFRNLWYPTGFSFHRSFCSLAHPFITIECESDRLNKCPAHIYMHLSFIIHSIRNDCAPTYKYYVRAVKMVCAMSVCSGERRLALDWTLIRHSTAFCPLCVVSSEHAIEIHEERLRCWCLAADLFRMVVQSMRFKWI